ncbi:MAG TPA: PCRF domain-containing protein, partial [Burkholderiales bacterium]|nr:PCRF domain-containing protein [Burkholderiales bacterium]
MNPRLRAKLDGMVGRLSELDGLLAAENATRDLEQFKRLSREHAEVSSVVSLFNSYLQVERDAAEARELAADPAMKAYADEELKKSRAAMERLEGELQTALLPKDPNDERNLFIEVRAGTGGDESALFAGDLFRMYTRYAERKGWQVELISESPSELG